MAGRKPIDDYGYDTKIFPSILKWHDEDSEQ